jgi:hypothetical protein
MNRHVQAIRASGLNVFLAAQGEALGLSETQRRSLLDDRMKIGYLDYDWSLNRVR